MLMYIMLWALGLLGPITLLVHLLWVVMGFFFAAFIFFGFLLLPSKLSGIVKLPLEVASTLQDHCLPQITITEPNFIQGIFSTLSNLKISSNFYFKFERGC